MSETERYDFDDERDWEGREVSMAVEAEANEGLIRVWVVSPHPTATRFDDLVVRGWQRMLRIVGGDLETILEREDGALRLGEKVTVSFQLQWFSLDEYMALDAP